MRIVSRWGTHPAHIRKGDRAIDRASPFSEIATDVGTFKVEQETYKGAYEAFLEARRAQRVALGELHVAERTLENERRTLGFAIFSAEQGRRNSQVYHAYFPKGFGDTLQIPPQQSLALTAGLIAALETETHPDIAARRDRLQAAYDGLVAAMAKRQEAADLVGKTKALLEDTGVEWRKAFNMFGFTLRASFPDRRTWVDSFFQMPDRTEVDEEESPEETEATEDTDETGEAPEASPQILSVPGGNIVPTPEVPPEDEQAAA
jgi:hypothetical protein